MWVMMFCTSIDRSIHSFHPLSLSPCLKKKIQLNSGLISFFLARQICPTRQKNVKRKKKENFRLTIGSALHQLEQGDERQAGEEPEPRPAARPLHFRVCVSFPVEGFFFTNKNSPILIFFFFVF